MGITLINLKDFKTVESLKEYINVLKNNQTIRYSINFFYGSFENFEKDIISQWEKTYNKPNQEDKLHKLLHDEEYQKQEIEKRRKALEEYHEKIQNKGIQEEQKIIKKENNINKKCKIFNHSFIKEGTEGVIKDIIKLTQQYVIVIGESNINYVNFKNVKIDEWKDIIIKGYDDKINNYKITISKDKIIINTWCDDVWIQEENNTYELKLDKKVYEKIDCNWENYRGAVLEYILAEVKSKKINKEYEEVCDKIKELENQKDKLLDDYEKEYDYTISLWKGLV